MESKTEKSNKRYTIIIGLGLALLPLHNLWLVEHINYNGQAIIHLPMMGLVLWILGSLFFLRDNFKKVNWFENKPIIISLIVIAVSIGISGLINLQFYPLLLGIVLLGSFGVGKVLGSNLWLMMLPFMMVSVVVSVVNGLLHPGVPASTAETYGLITNYCAGAGFLIFGAISNRIKSQWILIVVVLVGLFFIGALEAVFIVGVLGIVVIIRRDFSKQFFIILGVMIALVGAWMLIGKLVPLYTGNENIKAILSATSFNTETMTEITSGRWNPIIESLKDIRVFGHGFTTSTVEGGVIHNLPLIILYQIGIFGALAWVFVTVYCVIKSKLKYIWIAVIAMCVFDHYLWTQFYPYWWVLVGISMTIKIKNDYIFKKESSIEHLST